MPNISEVFGDRIADTPGMGCPRWPDKESKVWRHLLRWWHSNSVWKLNGKKRDFNFDSDFFLSMFIFNQTQKLELKKSGGIHFGEMWKPKTKEKNQTNECPLWHLPQCLKFPEIASFSSSDTADRIFVSTENEVQKKSVRRRTASEKVIPVF